MDNPFPKEYVGFCYEKNGQFYYCLEKNQTAADRWKKLVEGGCEVIHMADLEEHEEIKAFLVRGAYYANIVWPKLVREKVSA